MFTRTRCRFLSRAGVIQSTLTKPISGPDFREHRISDCVIFLQESLFKRCISIRVSQRHFRCNVCTKEESSTGLVRFQACEINRRGKQKQHGRARVGGGEGNGTEDLASTGSSQRLDQHDMWVRLPRSTVLQCVPYRTNFYGPPTTHQDAFSINYIFQEEKFIKGFILYS